LVPTAAGPKGDPDPAPAIRVVTGTAVAATSAGLPRPQGLKGGPFVAAGVRPVRVLEPAPAAITRRPIQVLLAWDGRIANGRIAPAIAVAQQA